MTYWDKIPHPATQQTDLIKILSTSRTPYIAAGLAQVQWKIADFGRTKSSKKICAVGGVDGGGDQKGRIGMVRI